MTKVADKLESKLRIINYLRDIERRAIKDESLSEEEIKKAFDLLIGGFQPKNKFLKQIHQDETGIVRKMYGTDACFEELFGSLCGHTKQRGIDASPTLIKKLKENNLLFPSKEVGVDYLEVGLISGIHKKGFTYFFAYLDEDKKVLVAHVYLDSDCVAHVRKNGFSPDYRWSASDAHRIVVPARKNLETQS